MAHFARVENGVVTDLIVISNNDIGGGDFPESEPLGQAFIAHLAQSEPRLEGTWLQTSYNDNFRGRLGNVGFTYDAELDQFIPPQPYPSWSLNDEMVWQAPVPYPPDGERYYWNEATQEWQSEPIN